MRNPMIHGYCKIEDIPERYWNRQIIKSINESFYEYDKKIEKLEKKEKRYKNKIWQKRSNIIPDDLDERIELYLNSKK